MVVDRRFEWHGYVWAVLLVACSAYDPEEIGPTPPPVDPAQVDSGQSGAGGVPEAGSSGGGGNAGSPAPIDGGPDASEPDASAGCEPNPAPDAGSCHEICPELCNGLDDDCDGEFDGEAADADCDAPHAEALCDLGECRLLECSGGHRDCDGRAGNGCEIAPDDPDNCGTCGKVCKLQNAIAGCEDGECVAIGCDDGYGDCDEDGESCELSTRTLTDCGECGQACGDLPNASPTCEDGECEVAACMGLYGDCNEEGDDGCEEKLDSLEHCGGCDEPCEKASCSGGVCTAVSCGSPLADCDRDEVDCEVDTSADVDHCGGCDLPCAFTTGSPNGSLVCDDSTCGTDCDADQGDCDGDYQNGCETPLLTTAAHCDGCGNDCAELLPHVASGSCAGGACDAVTCDSGWEDCDGEPENGCERDTGALGPCYPDTNCTKFVVGTHEYHFCTGVRSHSAARARCRLQTRGDLVHIDDATENAFVESHRSGNMWIGGNDAQREATFRWLDDGVPFWKGQGAAGAAVLGRYANFDTNQPDNAGDEDCVEIWGGGKWNDQPCTDTRGFVCEVRPDDCGGDASKIAPGQCGCGNPETDADGDSFAACADACESDVAKQAPGVCGCGAVEDITDSDGDMVANCVDGCDGDPTKTTAAACLGFAPASFDANGINWSAQPSSVLNCGTTEINSTDPDGAGPLIATITNWCGTDPVPQVQTQSGGPSVVIIPLTGLQIASSNSLRLIGDRPVILAVDGNITVSGSIDANGSGTTAGAGGNWSCGSSAGGNSTGGDCTGGSRGGGGGGFGTAGGQGGDGGGGNIGAAGASRPGSTLVPLYGGCNGGLGGGDGTDAAGGAGGGAVQLVASGSITVTGTVRANGGQGANGSCGNEAGGGGGGSGGAIFFEATSVTTTGATIQVNGGRGGNGGGGTSGGNGSTSSGSNGSTGGDGGGNGGGGGGGGYGRLRTLDH